MAKMPAPLICHPMVRINGFSSVNLGPTEPFEVEDWCPSGQCRCLQFFKPFFEVMAL